MHRGTDKYTNESTHRYSGNNTFLAKTLVRYTERKKNLADATDFLQSVVKGSTGGKKLQFPYELPPLQIEFTPQGRNTLIQGLGILGGGIFLNGLLNYLSRK